MEKDKPKMIVTLKDGEIITNVDFIYGKNDKLELRVGTERKNVLLTDIDRITTGISDALSK